MNNDFTELYNENGYVVLKNKIPRSRIDSLLENTFKLYCKYSNGSDDFQGMQDPWNTELFHRKLIEFRKTNPEDFGAIYDSLKTSLPLTQLVTDDNVVDNVARSLQIKPSDLSISEPMCRLGAKVTAIDASQKNINVASYHSNKNKLKINYLCSSPERLNLKKKFDVILNMEIVEHVDDLNLFLKKSSLLLKKNGVMFISTLNKTLKSYIFAIVGAEYILKWLPIGTHEWDKFVKPEELIEFGKKNSLELVKIDGVNFNILKNEWIISKDKSVNYITQFRKI